MSMPTAYGFLQARAVTAYLRSCDNLDDSIRRRVHQLCRGTPQISAPRYGRSFAFVTEWGSVVTWGHATFGGDSSGVAAQLTGVQSVAGSSSAFAAVKSDGTVVTWGDAHEGGDSSGVAAQLTGVQSVAGNARAFAAVKSDGTVVTWGRADGGGDSSAVAAQLSGW